MQVLPLVTRPAHSAFIRPWESRARLTKKAVPHTSSAQFGANRTSRAGWLPLLALPLALAAGCFKPDPAPQGKPHPQPSAATRATQTAYEKEALAALQRAELGSTLTPQDIEWINNLPDTMTPEQQQRAVDLMSLETTIAVEKFLQGLDKADTRYILEHVTPLQERLTGIYRESEDALPGLHLNIWVHESDQENQKRPDPKQPVLRKQVRISVLVPGIIGPSGPEILDDDDNLRMRVYLFDKGKYGENGIVSQALQVRGKGAKTRIEPFLYLNEKGEPRNPRIDPITQVNQCVFCHGTNNMIGYMQHKRVEKGLDAWNLKKMPGYTQFLEWGKRDLKDKPDALARVEAFLNDPKRFIPKEDWLKANHRRWLTLYPRYQEIMSRKSREAEEQKP